MINPGLMSSDHDDWCTPPLIAGLVKSLSPFGIGLDPCSNDRSIIEAKKCIALPNNGFAGTWREHGLVYVNPPYGNAISEWVRKGAVEFSDVQDDFDELVMLIPARTDTVWWHKYITTADAVCFWRGRIKFLRQQPSGTAPFPSALVYWGVNIEVFKDTFREYGWVVENRRR